MTKPAQIGIQILSWALLGALVLAFADGPAFDPLPGDHGRLTLAIAHLSERLEPCRQLSEAERMELPPTRRVTEVCERARTPVKVVLIVNERMLLAREFEPSGFHDDGRIYLVERWPLPAGHYRAELTLTGRTAETSRHEIFEFSLPHRANAVVDVEDHEIRLLNVIGRNEEHTKDQTS